MSELFDTYAFADHQEAMIETLGRVITMSIETLKIMDEMRPPGR